MLLKFAKNFKNNVVDSISKDKKSIVHYFDFIFWQK